MIQKIITNMLKTPKNISYVKIYLLSSFFIYHVFVMFVGCILCNFLLSCPPFLLSRKVTHSKNKRTSLAKYWLMKLLYCVLAGRAVPVRWMAPHLRHTQECLSCWPVRVSRGGELRPARWHESFSFPNFRKIFFPFNSCLFLHFCVKKAYNMFKT
jgi:hypothetical protein